MESWTYQLDNIIGYFTNLVQWRRESLWFRQRNAFQQQRVEQATTEKRTRIQKNHEWTCKLLLF